MAGKAETHGNLKSVVITGASTGIGAATAKYLAERGWQVFAGVRKQADFDTLSEMGGSLTPIFLDVTCDESVNDAVKSVGNLLGNRRLSGLVSNAGIAKMGPLAIQPLADFEAHFAVNVFGLLRVTQAFVPLLGADDTRIGDCGRIVTITSVGGRIASPFLGAYTATKHANESMSDSLRRELIVYGIDSITVGPGAVRTPIWEKAEKANADRPFHNSVWSDALQKFEDIMLQGGENGLKPEKIAKVIETALSDPSPKARYAPVPNKLTNFTIPTRLPKRMLDKIFWARFGLKKPG